MHAVDSINVSMGKEGLLEDGKVVGIVGCSLVAPYGVVKEELHRVLIGLGPIEVANSHRA